MSLFRVKQTSSGKIAFPAQVLTAALILSGGLPLYADTADRPDFEGTWLWTLIIFDDPRWRMEDLLCEFCTIEAFEYLQRLLADPANDDRSLDEIQGEVRIFNQRQHESLLTAVAQRQVAAFDPADDPVVLCEPVGLIRQVIQNPLPMKIEQYEDRMVFRYEYWNTVRAIHMDGRDHPADLTPSRLGHSIGWYDGETLVIDTRGITPALYGNRRHIGGFTTSPRAVVVERYTRRDDGSRLELELSVLDPVALRRPLVRTISWLSIPDVEFLDFVCEAVSGERQVYG